MTSCILKIVIEKSGCKENQSVRLPTLPDLNLIKARDGVSIRGRS